jgi:primosomal protein N' (replication factor Y)
MVAKGLDFPRVTVVGVLAADRGLAMPDFRAAERTWQLVAQVSGRAGRGERPGMVVVQAFDPEAAPLQAALQHRPKTFVDGELALRREYGYPPYGALVRLLWSGPDAARVVQAARQDGPEFVAAAAANGSALLGPAPAAMPLLKGQHRWSALLKGPHRPALQAVLDAALPRLARHGGVRLAVDVDPMSTG